MAVIESRDFYKGERAYIISDDSLPVYVGDGLGDLDYKDAFELCVIKRTAQGLPATPEIISQFAPPPEKPKREWKDYRGKSKKTSYTSRASKNNPYICDNCGYRTTRYSNMIAHLEKVHGDFSTDPRSKSIAVQQGIVEQLKAWKAL